MENIRIKYILCQLWGAAVALGWIGIFLLENGDLKFLAACVAIVGSIMTLCTWLMWSLDVTD